MEYVLGLGLEWCTTSYPQTSCSDVAWFWCTICYFLIGFLSPSTVSGCSCSKIRCILNFCFVCLCVCIHYVYLSEDNGNAWRRPLFSNDKDVWDNSLSLFTVCGGKFVENVPAPTFSAIYFPTTPPGAIRHGAIRDRYSFKVCYVGQVLTAEGKQWQNIMTSLWLETHIHQCMCNGAHQGILTCLQCFGSYFKLWIDSVDTVLK